MTGVVTTTVSHYSFGSLRIAVKRGSDLFHLHGDHLSSTSLTTRGSSTTASRTYYAYGSERSTSGDLQTDRTFTGQKSDATGLLYYNARYYGPALGTFISPDSLEPGALRIVDYNRYLYAGANPLKYTDPTGHCPWCIAAAVGAVVGGAVSYGTQVVGNVRESGLYADAFTDVNWARVGAGAVTGAISAGTMGLAPAVVGTGVVATVGTRIVVGAAEGQVAIVVENVLSGQAPLAGVGDLEQIAFDAAFGAFDFPSSRKANPFESITTGPTSTLGLVDDATVDAVGGTYVLQDRNTREVMRTGRTNDLNRSGKEHRRHSETGHLEFRVDMPTDDYNVQRGREHLIPEEYNHPPLNRIRPISPRNPRRELYIEAAEREMERRNLKLR